MINLKKSLIFCLVFLTMIGWIFSGWPTSFSFAQEATTTASTIDVMEVTSTSATTTDAVALLPPLPEVSTTTGEVLGTSTSTAPQSLPDPEQATDEEDNQVPQVEESVVLPPVPSVPSVLPKPLLLTRTFTKHIKLDKSARHSCEAATFRIDMSNQTSASARFNLWKDSDASYEMEIGSLPNGIDITFVKNGRYLYPLVSQERTADLTITKQEGAQRGDFSIPIIYTKKGISDSSVVCQLNIVNL